jgi:hypothetical protein
MSTTSPSHGFYMPQLSDVNPRVEDMNQWALEADTFVVPRFTTRSERNSAYAGITTGPLLCYVEETGEWYKTGPSGVSGFWLSWIPRKYVLRNDLSITQDYDANGWVTAFTFLAEADSIYDLRGSILFTVPGEKLVMRIVPQGGGTYTGVGHISYDDIGEWGISHIQVTAGSNDQRMEFFKNVYFWSDENVDTTAVLQFSKIGGGSGTVHAWGTYIEVWKTG